MIAGYIVRASVYEMDELDKIAKILEEQGQKDSDSLSKSAQTSLDLAKKIADEASNSASEMVATYKVAITEIKKVINEYKKKTREKNIEVAIAQEQVKKMEENSEQDKERIVATVKEEDEKEKRRMKMEFDKKINKVKKDANVEVSAIQLELTKIKAENDNLRIEMKTNAKMHDAEKTSLENQLQILGDQTKNQINQKERLHDTIVKKMKKQLETITKSRDDTEKELEGVRKELSDVNDNLALAKTEIKAYKKKETEAVRRKVSQARTLEEVERIVDKTVVNGTSDETSDSESVKPKESDESDNSNEGNTVTAVTKDLIEANGYKKLRY